MTLKEIYFKPVGEFTFTDEEISVLMECSDKHYDSKCKQVGKHGGFLYGMNNRATWDREENKERSTHSLDTNKLDTLAKIAEVTYALTSERGAVAWMLNAALRRSMKALYAATPDNAAVTEPV